MVPSTMAKPGRNDPCPCGSGNKYKKCCQPKDEAAERAGLAEAQAKREEYAAERRQHERELRAEALARLAQAAQEDEFEDELDAASNAVVDLVNAGKLDEAEAAARALLARYPEVHDGWDRLGMVYEKRGNTREAADCYRRVLDFLRENPDYTDDDGLTTLYTALIAKLDPPPAT
jgi:tetratricopeptide (TPR) repeat protein